MSLEYHDYAMIKSNFDKHDKSRYWTEPWITEALVRRLKKEGGFEHRFASIWEPACGRGDMVRELRKYYTFVCPSDIDISEYDESLGSALEVNFLNEDKARADAIITNPPYYIAEEFVKHALSLWGVSLVAMLLKNEWDCAKSRNYLFEDKRFAMKIVLTSRPRWDNWREKDKPDKSPRHNFSWFLWIDNWNKPPILRYEGKE